MIATRQFRTTASVLGNAFAYKVCRGEKAELVETPLEADVKAQHGSKGSLPLHTAIDFIFHHATVPLCFIHVPGSAGT